MEQISREDILQYAKQQYGTDPEYLWIRFPNYAVLRQKENGKWYAAIMDVPAKRLGLNGDTKIDILDIKCDPAIIGSLRKSKGFLPAYHMNKDTWITILLDGSVPKAEVLALLNLSYDITKKISNPPLKILLSQSILLFFTAFFCLKKHFGRKAMPVFGALLLQTPMKAYGGKRLSIFKSAISYKFAALFDETVFSFSA